MVNSLQLKKKFNRYIFRSEQMTPAILFNTPYI